MNMIQNFSNLFELNTYFNSIKNSNLVVKIDSIQKFFVWKLKTENLLLLRRLALQELTEEAFNSEVAVLMGEEAVFTTSVLEPEYQGYTETIANNDFIYVYPWSKTNFRKILNINLPESLYKKFYYLSKETEKIILANGSCVAFRGLFDQEEFDKLNENSSQDAAINISVLVEQFSNMKLDIAYYIERIQALEAAVDVLTTDNNNLLNQINNKYLTSWA